jgi:hypothetical protein
MGRLLPTAGVLMAALLLTNGMWMPARVAVVAAAFAGALLVLKTVKISELKALRAMRVA